MFRKTLPQRERIDLVETASSQIFEKDGIPAMKYLKQRRGFTDRQIRNFKIGYVPQWVTSVDEQGRSSPHQAAGRIVYPIYDRSSNLVAISTRDWRQTNGEPTPLFGRRKFWHESFQKTFYMYGVNVAKTGMKKYKKAVIVQGQHDTLKMHQNGFNMTVGILGSAPTVQHLIMLCGYCDQIFFCFDSDKAGKQALERARSVCKQNMIQTFGMKTFFVQIPQPQHYGVQQTQKKIDPDYILTHFGKDEMVRLLRQSKNQF